MGTPENFNGTQPPDFGKGYAGLYLYAPDDYREYIQVPLTQTPSTDSLIEPCLFLYLHKIFHSILVLD